MRLTPRTRARLAVALTGLVTAVVLALSLALIGGPNAGRRDRRDLTRLSDIREIAQALTCAAGGEGEAAARPAELAAIGPDCLSPEAAARLRDPVTGAAYAITWTSARTARVCAAFETPARSWSGGWPPFDPATGCVTASMAR